MLITGILGAVLAMGSVQVENGQPRPREGGLAFERFDLNHDGVIDRGEFDRTMRQRRDSGDRRGPNAGPPQGPPQGAPGAGPMHGPGEIRERIREKVREHVRREMGERMNACPNCPMKKRDGHRAGPPEGERRGAPRSEMRRRHGHDDMEHQAPPPPNMGPGRREFKSHGPSRDGGPGKQDGPRMRGERRMGRLFERFDEDHDGTVNREEIRRTIRRHAQPPTNADRKNEKDRDD